MTKQYEEIFTDAELGFIIEQGIVFVCACPAQLAMTLRKARTLCRYQAKCLSERGGDLSVHLRIADGAIEAHAALQDCLVDVLKMEGWDRVTLKMPEGLRQKQVEELTGDT